MNEKLDVTNTLKDQSARAMAYTEQQERILAQINSIKQSSELVDMLSEYFESVGVVNDRENHAFLEAFVAQMDLMAWADRGTALSLVNVIMKNLAEFERSQSARNQYQVKLIIPDQLLSLLTFEDCSNLLNTLVTSVAFNK